MTFFGPGMFYIIFHFSFFFLLLTLFILELNVFTAPPYDEKHRPKNIVGVFLLLFITNFFFCLPDLSSFNHHYTGIRRQTQFTPQKDFWAVGVSWFLLSYSSYSSPVTLFIFKPTGNLSFLILQCTTRKLKKRYVLKKMSMAFFGLYVSVFLFP